MELRECFYNDFTTWLKISNNNKVIRLRGETNLDEERFRRDMKTIEEECISEMTEILILNPNIKWFYYNNDSVEAYNMVSGLVWGFDEIEPGYAISLDTNKAKSLLRDIKIKSILND